MTLFNPDSARTNNAANSIAARALDGASLKTLSSANFNALQKGNGLDVQLNPDLLGLTVARAGPAWNPNWTGISGDRVGRLVEYAPNRVRSGDHGVVKETAAATNRVQNPRMEGGDPGTLTGGSPSGTLPSRMALDAQGATVEFIGYAVTAGRTEALFRFSGTPTGDPILYFEPAATAIASATTNTRTGQATVRLAAGALTNTAGVAVRVQELTSAGANVTGGSSAFILPDANQRGIFNARTLSGGGTVARARHGIIIDHTSGAIDLTLAVSVPQFESGLVATTPGLPPPGDPGEFTRAAETFTFGAFETVRASRETYENADGSLSTFLANTIAYGTDGVQVTDGSTNGWTYSDDLTDAVWTKGGCTITPNAALAPNGDMTADRVTMSTGSGQFIGLVRFASFVADEDVTISAHFRYEPGGVRYIQMYLGLDTFPRINFDILAGVITVESSGSTPGFRAHIEKRGAYVRVGITVTAQATASVDMALFPINTPNAGLAASATWAGGESFIMWRGQAEPKAYMSPPIGTVAATASRAGGAPVIRGSWLIPDQPFAIVCDVDIRGLSRSGFPRFWAIGSDDDNFARLLTNLATGEVGLDAKWDNITGPVIGGGSGLVEMGARLRTVSVINPGAHILAVNGALIGTSDNAVALSLGSDPILTIGRSIIGGSFFDFARFIEVAYIPFNAAEFPDTTAKAIELSTL